MARNFALTILATAAGAAVCLTLALICFDAAEAQEPGAPGDGSLRIGVVKLRDCLKGERYAWVKEIDAQLLKFAEEFKAEQAAQERKIQNIIDKLGGVKKGSSLYYSLLRDKQVEEAKLEAAQKVGQLKYANIYTKKKTEVFNEILRVTEIVGRERGFDIVLRVEEPYLDEEEALRETVSRRMSRRAVLYHSARVDITEEVITRLNEEFRKKEKAGDGGAAKPYFCDACRLDCSTGQCPRCGKALQKKEQ
ncbi:MAG: OmpH/Skp family outer membrane protein [Planctomycetota bacterium]|jgi:Skp family chaperone for outer membrane proteins